MAETITCPACQRSLQVPESYFGQTVQCPECGHQFTATAESVTSTPKPASVAAGKRWSSEPDEDDYPRSRRDRYADDDDLDDIAAPRRIRNRLPPHRGGLIMALGLVSLIGGSAICFPVIIGPIAWFMAHADLRAMRDGEMDPTGESMVRTGQVCGIISTIILVVSIGIFGLFILGAAFG